MIARLALEDGTVVRGPAFGAPVAGEGEVVFCTALSGYQEVVTDPSYRGQIVIMTAPEIGNVGWNDEDLESARPWVSALVVRSLSPVVSNWRAKQSLHEALAIAGVPGISGVDTRALTHKLRDQGNLRGILTSDASLSDHDLVEKVRATPSMEGQDLVRAVTCAAPYDWSEGSESLGRLEARRPLDHHVVAYDFGLKRNILRRLVDSGCRVTVVPATTPAADVLAMSPSGIFLSNGPGDPAAVTYGVEACRQLLASGLPLFGICLGHQILSLALGGRTYKLKFGHHGANQPVMDLVTRKVEITSQNHGFAVDVAALAGVAELSHVNLNDHTVEGLRVVGKKAFSVQYHPEASPGPHDSAYLFRRFVEMIESR